MKKQASLNQSTDSTVEQSNTLDPPKPKLEDFQIIETIGKGSFGMVKLARREG